MSKRTIAALVLASLSGTACGSAPETSVGTRAQALELSCDPNSGTNPIMASLAVAIATEVGRLQPLTDLEARDANGQLLQGNWASATEVQLSAAALSRCSARGAAGCPESANLLALQQPGPTPYTSLDWGTLDATNYFWALVSGFDRQATHEQDLAMNSPELLAGEHELYRRNSVTEGACGVLIEFAAIGENIEHLDSKLFFFGGDSNPYLDFHASNGVISIDPSVVDPPPLTNGSACVDACLITGSQFAGVCCICNGMQGEFTQVRRQNYACRW